MSEYLGVDVNDLLVEYKLDSHLLVPLLGPRHSHLTYLIAVTVFVCKALQQHLVVIRKLHLFGNYLDLACIAILPQPLDATQNRHSIYILCPFYFRLSPPFSYRCNPGPRPMVRCLLAFLRGYTEPLCHLFIPLRI